MEYSESSTMGIEVKQETIKEQDMSRMSRDALIVQSKLAAGEVLTIDYLATEVFGVEDEKTKVRTKTAVSTARAIRASLNLVTMKRAIAIPMNARQNITAIRSTDESGGVQAEALMNMVVRSGVDRRKEDRDAPDRRQNTDPLSPQ